jgi:hypothetical protein
MRSASFASATLCSAAVDRSAAQVHEDVAGSPGRGVKRVALCIRPTAVRSIGPGDGSASEVEAEAAEKDLISLGWRTFCEQIEGQRRCWRQLVRAVADGHAGPPRTAYFVLHV